MRPYVLWLLTAVGLLAVTTQAAHAQEASSGSSLTSSYANDPRPDAVNEEQSVMLGTGGAYEFRLPQPQINKQQQQQQQQQRPQQHKTKRPNTTATYVTTTKTSSTSSSSAGSATKWVTKRPAGSTTNASGNKATSSGTSSPTTTTAQQSQQPGFAYNVSVTPQQAAYQPATPGVSNVEPAITQSTVNDDESPKKIIGSRWVFFAWYEEF